MAKKVTRSDEKKSIFGLDVNGPVFFTSTIFIIVSIALTIIFEKKAEKAFANIQHAVAENAGAIITTLEDKPFKYGKSDYKNLSLIIKRSKALDA